MRRLGLLVIPLMAISFLTNCVETVEHLVSFETAGGTHIPAQRIKDGEKVVKPEDPTRGYDHFLGWYSNGDNLYTFNEEVKEDITLYADWEKAKDYYHFKFTGHNCTLRSKYNYETDIALGTCEHFEIVLDNDYSLPTDDEIHFNVKKGKDIVNYNSETGVITINEMASDVEIEATAIPTDYFSFSFSGINCSINGLSNYQEDIKSGSSKQYTILPNDGYVVPTSLDLPDFASYKNGVITITSMDDNIILTGINAPTEEIKYTINFNGINCKGKGGSITDFTRSFQIDRSSKDSDDVVINVATDDEMHILPDAIEIYFDNVAGTEEDYSYDASNGTIVIKKMANVLIIVNAITDDSYCTVTFDAGEGYYYSKGQKIIFKVSPDTDFLAVLPLVGYPIKPEATFLYYSYDDDTEIKYNDKIDEDITIKAHYSDTEITKPIEDLDTIPAASEEERWKIIKSIAVTHPRIEEVFALGATKTVSLYNLNHKIRIISFHQDKLATNTSFKVGITFDFLNVITNSNGAITTHWSEEHNKFYVTSTVATKIKSIYNDLPDYLKENIESVKKQYLSGDFKSRHRTNFDTNFFLLGESELSAESPTSPEYDGDIYQFYEEFGDDYTYKVPVGTEIKPSNAVCYWLRTPSKNNNTDAWTKQNPEGFSTHGVNQWDDCIAPAFCL